MSEFKKESIEEVAKRYCTEKQNEYDSSIRSFTDGAKWQQQQINCELSELKEQRDEMLAMLRKSKLTISRIKNSMMAHPDCVEGSEFDDYTELAEQQEYEIELLIKKVKDNE